MLSSRGLKRRWSIRKERMTGKTSISTVRRWRKVRDDDVQETVENDLIKPNKTIKPVDRIECDKVKAAHEAKTGGKPATRWPSPSRPPSTCLSGK